MKEEIRPETGIINKEEKTLLKVSIGYASFAAGSGNTGGEESGEEAAGRAAPGEEECFPEPCGDTAISCHLPDGSRAVILSDGMGRGTAAAAESRLAAGMLRRLLKQGMTVARAIQEVNLYLLTSTGRCRDLVRRESFATLDVMILDRATGRARFYKQGAAPSYLIRGGRLRKVEQPALPVGILPGLKLTHVSARLSAGDIIVMMSDGICDSDRRQDEASGTGCGADSGADSGADCSADCNSSLEAEADWVADYLLSVIDDEYAGRQAAGRPAADRQAAGRPGAGGQSAGNQTAGRQDGCHLGPRQLASRILEEARCRYGEGETDDATVAVVMIR